MRLEAKYVYDRENVILDLNVSDGIIAKYIYAPHIDEPLVMIKKGIKRNKCPLFPQNLILPERPLQKTNIYAL